MGDLKSARKLEIRAMSEQQEIEEPAIDGKWLSRYLGAVAASVPFMAEAKHKAEEAYMRVVEDGRIQIDHEEFIKAFIATYTQLHLAIGVSSF
jgi:hypothetical protein